MGLPRALRDYALSRFHVYGPQHPALVWYVCSCTPILCGTVELMFQTTIYILLDPANGKGHLAAYTVGIAVGGAALFLIMWAVTKFRDRIFRRGRGVRVIDLSEQQDEKMRAVRA